MAVGEKTVQPCRARGARWKPLAPIRHAEVGAAKIMIERTEERFGIKPERLAANTAYGSAANLGSHFGAPRERAPLLTAARCNLQA